MLPSKFKKTLIKLQRRCDALGRPRIDIGVGINTGAMVVGNMGSRKRFNFTILGDKVNMASRLEGTHKTFGTRLIISENTYQAVQNEMLVRELDLIRVKGKTKPVKIFELVGTVAESDQHVDRINRFGRGLEAYREGQWATALEIFEALALDFPQDGPSHVFVNRCHDFLLRPPRGCLGRGVRDEDEIRAVVRGKWQSTNRSPLFWASARHRSRRRPGYLPR